MKRIIFIGVSLAFILNACGGNVGQQPPVSFNKEIGLQQVTNWDEFNQKMRVKALQQLEESSQVVPADDSYCKPQYYYDAAPSASQSGNVPSGVTSEAPAEFTTTNVQESAVDEADIVKSNGTHLFVAKESKVKIYQIWPINSFKASSEIALESGQHELYLDGKFLVVVSHQLYATYMAMSVANSNSEYANQNTETQVKVFDISNLNSIKQINEYSFVGNFIDTRKKGNTIHVITQGNVTSPSLEYADINYEEVCNDGKLNKELYLEKVAATNNTNKTIIEKFDYAAAFQQYQAGQSNKAVKTLYFSALGNSSNMINVNSFKLEEDAFHVTSINAYGNTVYASRSYLFLTEENYQEDATHIHQFSMDQASNYLGSGVVVGHIVDRFAMSESKDVFRIATTQGEFGKQNVSTSVSQVYTLMNQDNKLEIIGKIENIAPTEKIYSVRFIGDYGYLVTFKKVDPLFVLDLHDPYNPSIKGELKIPGFSSYLHPMDAGHLLGLGKDAEDVGDFAWFQGLKLSVFDIVDPANPLESDSEILGGRYSDSEALYEPHAFTYDNNAKLLALPVSIYTKSAQGGSSTGSFDYEGIQVFHINDNYQVEIMGTYKSSNNEGNYYYGMAATRTMFIGDTNTKYLIVVDANTVRAHQLNAGLTVVKSISDNN